MNFYKRDNKSAIQAMSEAQRIAFAPVVFQVARTIRDNGLLSILNKSSDGKSLEELVEMSEISHYGVRVLMEASLGIGLVTKGDDGLYKITKTGWFILHDEITRVNMDFVQDVCYKGLFNLDESIRTGKPEGLKNFGEWKTIYEALSKLPSQVQKSWFSFDHYYSDVTFKEALPLVFDGKVKTLLDIGGNTGKWTMHCLEYDENVHITIMDLPGQVTMAKRQIDEKGFTNRVSFFETNLLDESLPFPEQKFDVIWMSQFLDCFGDDEIISILKRVKNILSAEGKIYILEPFWNRQRFEASAFSLQQTSIYFTAIANGNSQMYHSDDFINLIKSSGLKVTEEYDELGVSNSILICQPS